MSKTVLFACGGTGGHIYPAIAMAQMIQAKCPDTRIVFVGTEKGRENTIVPKYGYPLEHVEIQGLRRSLSPRNIKALWLALTAPASKKVNDILDQYNPDCIIGTGAYVCYPMLMAGAKRGIPTFLHESNAIPGLAVKVLQFFVDEIWIGMRGTEKKLLCKKKAHYTGNPCRTDFADYDRESARKLLNIHEKQKLVVAFGGSLGAKKLNEAVLKTAEQLGENVVVHLATGTRFFEEVPKDTKVLCSPYFDPIAPELSAADCIVCRCGAMTLSEIGKLGRGTVLCPSPNVVANHQYKNAKSLEKYGAGILCEGETESDEIFADNMKTAVEKILSDAPLRHSLARGMRQYFYGNPEEEIWKRLSTIL